MREKNRLFELSESANPFEKHTKFEKIFLLVWTFSKQIYKA
jgi:hypothetical protein